MAAIFFKMAAIPSNHSYFYYITCRAVFGPKLYIFVLYIFTIIIKKTFAFVFPSYIGKGGGYYFLFVCYFFLFFFCLCVFLNKHSCCFILKIYHLRCSLIDQFILTAFIEKSLFWISLIYRFFTELGKNHE